MAHSGRGEVIILSPVLVFLPQAHFASYHDCIMGPDILTDELGQGWPLNVEGLRLIPNLKALH